VLRLPVLELKFIGDEPGEPHGLFTAVVIAVSISCFIYFCAGGGLVAFFVFLPICLFFWFALGTNSSTGSNCPLLREFTECLRIVKLICYLFCRLPPLVVEFTWYAYAGSA